MITSDKDSTSATDVQCQIVSNTWQILVVVIKFGSKTEHRALKLQI